ICNGAQAPTSKTKTPRCHQTRKAVPIDIRACAQEASCLIPPCKELKDPSNTYVASIYVILLKVPPHATPVSQPADVVWNFPLKSRLLQHWHDDMRNKLSSKRQRTRRPRSSGQIAP
ncbi:hypothetical protein GN958_ATG18757, partial [Phytophthora infestans]